MTSDVSVYIALNGSDKRRVIVDGSLALVIDLLRTLGREALEQERAAALEANHCAPTAEENSIATPE